MFVKYKFGALDLSLGPRPMGNNVWPTDTIVRPISPTQIAILRQSFCMSPKFFVSKKDAISRSVQRIVCTASKNYLSGSTRSDQRKKMWNRYLQKQKLTFGNLITFSILGPIQL